MLLVLACDTDNLELDNPNELDTDTFFKNPQQLQSAVDATYANLQSRGLYMRHMFFMNDNMGHECAPNPQQEADKLAYFNFSFTSVHDPIRRYWDNCYRGINKANFVIENEERFENVSPDMIDRAIGEAKFMRGFYYFLLVTRFGDVPLYDSIADIGRARSPKSEVYAMIIEDFKEASERLPDKTGTTDLGRATSGAALGFLGKAYLYTEQYDLARQTFASITGYELTENYIDNFLEETEHNIESLFEVNFDLTGNTSDKWANDIGGGINHITFRGQEYGFNNWFNSYPNPTLTAEYEAGDPRYADNFYSNGDLFSMDTIEVQIPNDRDAAWRKYQNYYKQPNENEASGINMRVMRYADVLLMWAEAENALGNTGLAVSLMNQVRDRVNMPQYGTPEMDAIYPVGSQQEVFNAIVHERMVELAGEQLRFSDLVRWGLAETVLAGTGFTPGKSEVFPIPQSEIDNNPNLTDADQNPGY